MNLIGWVDCRSIALLNEWNGAPSSSAARQAKEEINQFNAPLQMPGIEWLLSLSLFVGGQPPSLFVNSFTAFIPFLQSLNYSHKIGRLVFSSLFFSSFQSMKLMNERKEKREVDSFFVNQIKFISIHEWRAGLWACRPFFFDLIHWIVFVKERLKSDWRKKKRRLKWIACWPTHN